MTPSIRIPATLRPSRKKAAVLFVICSLFVAGGVWMVLDGKPTGYFCAAFFALGLPVFALQFHPKAAYLRLAPEGFTFCSLFRVHRVAWEDVRGFAVIQVGPNRMVGWNYARDDPATANARAVSKALSGCEAALPDTYGMSARELAGLMEDLRLRHAGNSGA